MNMYNQTENAQVHTVHAIHQKLCNPGRDRAGTMPKHSRDGGGTKARQRRNRAETISGQIPNNSWDKTRKPLETRNPNIADTKWAFAAFPHPHHGSKTLFALTFAAFSLMSTIRHRNKPKDFNMSQDRRNFLKHVGAGAAAAAAVVKVSEAAAQGQEVTASVLSSARSNGQVKLALELDGEFAGWLSSVEGGSAYSDVVEEQTNDLGITKKHIGGVKYEDITIKFGTGMSKGFYNWVAGTFAHKHVRQDGSIIAADYNYNVRSILEFTQALISEVGFPALDAASKDAAKITVKFAPEFTRAKKGGGKLNVADSKQQKQFLPSNFRLTIDGLEASCAKVSKVEGLTIKQNLVESAPGDSRDSFREPGKIEFPNIKITLPEAFADQFAAWHEDFVIKGNNSDEAEKSGSLEFLDSTHQKALLTLTFKNIGIFKFQPDFGSPDSDKFRGAKAEMYCEEIKFAAIDVKL
jgi:hypothetical protein